MTLCSLLQKFEKKGLCDQLQRAAVSISSNIAEGAARSTDADFAHFLDFALGSAFEVETQLKISKNVGYMDEEHYQEMTTKLSSIERQLNALISSSMEGNRDRCGVAGGVTLRPAFYRPLRFIVEWDGVGVNVGADVLLWRHLFIQAALIHGQGFTGGLAYHYTIKF